MVCDCLCGVLRTHLEGGSGLSTESEVRWERGKKGSSFEKRGEGKKKKVLGISVGTSVWVICALGGEGGQLAKPGSCQVGRMAGQSLVRARRCDFAAILQMHPQVGFCATANVSESTHSWIGST